MVLSCIATIKLLLRRTLVRLIILISFFLTVFTITHFIDGIVYFFLDKKKKNFHPASGRIAGFAGLTHKFPNYWFNLLVGSLLALPHQNQKK